jgi:hypothetical protein
MAARQVIPEMCWLRAPAVQLHGPLPACCSIELTHCLLQAAFAAASEVQLPLLRAWMRPRLGLHEVLLSPATPRDQAVVTTRVCKTTMEISRILHAPGRDTHAKMLQFYETHKNRVHACALRTGAASRESLRRDRPVRLAGLTPPCESANPFAHTVAKVFENQAVSSSQARIRYLSAFAC